MTTSASSDIEVLIDNERHPDDHEECQSYIVLDLLGLKLILVVAH